MVFMGLFLWRSVREQTSWEPALGKGDHCTPVLHTILTGLGSTRQVTLLKPGPRKAGPEPGDRMSYLTQLHSLFSGVPLVVFCPGRRQTLSDGTATNCHVHRVLWAGLIHIRKQMPHHCGMRSAQAVSTVWVLTRSVGQPPQRQFSTWGPHTRHPHSNSQRQRNHSHEVAMKSVK